MGALQPAPLGCGASTLEIRIFPMGYHAEFGPSGSNGLGLIKGVGKKLRGAGPINPIPWGVAGPRKTPSPCVNEFGGSLAQTVWT